MRAATCTGPAREALRVAVDVTFRRDSIDPTYAQVDDLIDHLGNLGYEIVERNTDELPL